MLQIPLPSGLPQVEAEEHELVIVGAGPAGLTAALYASRYKLDCIVLERDRPGGALLKARTIENYPGFPDGVSGEELARRMEEQVRKLGVPILKATVLDLRLLLPRKEIATDSKTFAAPAVIIATGVGRRERRIPGEDELVGRGVSYCASCDAPLYKGKRTLVAGNGEEAVRETLILAQHAEHVVFACEGKLSAPPSLAQQLRSSPNVEVLEGVRLEAIEGERFVERAHLKKADSGEELTLEVAGVFLYLGTRPPHDLFRELELDEKGFIRTDEEMRTNVDGVFAAGDVRAKSLRQVATAVSDGAIAAHSAWRYLREKGSGETRSTLPSGQ